jgi:hypothetical protein
LEIYLLDKLKDRLKENFDNTNFIFIDKKDKYDKNYYGLYFIHVNIGKNGKPKISFIDKPLSNVFEEKGVLKYTFGKTIIDIKDNNDILYAIVNKNIELSKRYLSLTNFYVNDKEKKLNGSYFSFFLEDEKKLKEIMNGTSSIKGDIIIFKNQSISEYFETMKKSYEEQVIKYQKYFRNCTKSFNIGMFTDVGWEDVLKNEPIESKLVCPVYSTIKIKKKVRINEKKYTKFYKI